MKSETKENISIAIGIIIIAIIISVVIFGLFSLVRFSDSERERFKIERKQEFKTCLDKSNDINWCYDEFINN